MATTTTLVKAARTLIAAGTSCASGGVVRGTVDLRTAQGGLLTIKLNNTGSMATQAEARILVAHNTGATPTAAGAGADWKTVQRYGNGVVSGTTNEWSYLVPKDVMHLEVEVTGNTTNAVTCEAYLSETSSASSV